VWVHGFSVAGTPTFPLTFDAVQGSDLSVSEVPSGAVPAGTPVTLHVDFAKSMTAGQDYSASFCSGRTALRLRCTFRSRSIATSKQESE
jgi:hypothetical protein